MIKHFSKSNGEILCSMFEVGNFPKHHISTENDYKVNCIRCLKRLVVSAERKVLDFNEKIRVAEEKIKSKKSQ